MTALSYQVETATVLGSVTLTGDATITITSAWLTGSPLAVAVAVLLGDAAADVAGKARDTLSHNAAVDDRFHVSGTGAQIVLTAREARPNDPTLNIAIDNGTCTGLTPAPVSTHTTAGAGVAILYGSVGEVAALSTPWTKAGAFDSTTHPTSDMVAEWLQNLSSQMSLALANHWFDLRGIADAQDFQTKFPDVFNALNQAVTSMVADLVEFTNKTGRFYTDVPTKNSGKTVYQAIYSDLDAWVVKNARGLIQLGLPQMLDALAI